MDAPIKIGFDQVTNKVTLYLELQDRAPNIRAFDRNGEQTRAEVKVTSAGGRHAVVMVGGDGVQGIEIRVDTPVSLYGACVDVVTTTGQTREWTCFNVARSTTPPLQPPAGLVLDPVPLVETGAAASMLRASVRPGAQRGNLGIGAGLRWEPEISSTAMSNRGTVVYHVYRRSLGNGQSPAPLATPVDLTAFVRLTEDASQPGYTIPMPLRPKAHTAASTPAGWPQTPVHYVDGPLSDRWYAYAITGVDLFGRVSAPVAATIELRDRQPPPPPANFSASFIDPAIAASDPAYDSNAEDDGSTEHEGSGPRVGKAGDRSNAQDGEIRHRRTGGRCQRLSGAGRSRRMMPEPSSPATPFPTADMIQVDFPIALQMLQVALS